MSELRKTLHELRETVRDGRAIGVMEPQDLLDLIGDALRHADVEAPLQSMDHGPAKIAWIHDGYGRWMPMEPRTNHVLYSSDACTAEEIVRWCANLREHGALLTCTRQVGMLGEQRISTWWCERPSIDIDVFLDYAMWRRQGPASNGEPLSSNGRALVDHLYAYGPRAVIRVYKCEASHGK